MINNSFDDHIKKRFSNYEPEVPEHVWENIVAGKEKRRPAGLLFDLAGNRITFILVVLILSAGGAILVHSINNNNTGKNAIAAKESSPGKTNILTENNSNSPNQTQNEKTSTIEKTNTVTGETIHSNADNAVITETVRNETIVHMNDAAKNNSKNNLVTPKKQSTSFSQLHDPGNDAATTGQLAPGKNKRKHSASKTSILTSSAGTENPDTKDITITAANNSELSLEKYYLNLNTPLPEKPFTFSVKNHNVPALNIPCPAGEKNAAGNKRYFEIYGGPDYVFRTFNDTANSAYLKKRKESTSFTSAFSVGFRYTKVFDNAMSFRTGINYSQVNEKFKFEQGHIIQLVYNIDANGDTTGSYATTGTRYKTTHNHYKTLDIPLAMGYEMGNGRLHTNINAGIVVNIYSWQKGDVLDDTYQPVNITTGNSSSPYQFKSNIGIGFMGGVSFYYKLTDRLHILGEPYFRYNLSASNKSDITLKQKYTTTGLRFGLRIDF